MMATESPQEKSNEATVTSDSEPVRIFVFLVPSLIIIKLTLAAICQVIKIDADSQNVDPDLPQINGDAASTGTDEIENKHISDIVDDLVNSAEVSVSGGSDTEASRSKLKDDEKGHGRTSSSVKKPASFKSVSVNKTFLAAKGSTTSVLTKVNDKPAATTTLSSSPGGASASAARPRLVAKSGSGLVTKSSTLNGGKPGSAPDPNAVWNKNRRKFMACHLAGSTMTDDI
jgi:hypothetical protein